MLQYNLLGVNYGSWSIINIQELIKFEEERDYGKTTCTLTGRA